MTLGPISFAEMSHFVQKNYELDMAACEVIAMRLRETFERYNLSAHPSYFAGIPRNILDGLLRANRRAELIELAVAGYLSFVVAEDKEPISLSRTTREKFPTEIAYRTNTRGEHLTESQVTVLASEFAQQFDFGIAPARFVSAFFENNGNVTFTLPFVERHLLAKRLIDDPEIATAYFSLDSDIFDYETFTLYAEIGAAPKIAQKVQERLDDIIAELERGRANTPILLSRELAPALLRSREKALKSLRECLEQAEKDVRLGHDYTREKQRLLDVNDELRDETESRIAKAATSQRVDEGEGALSIEARAGSAWSTAVVLLGSGAERLEAQVKRGLIDRIVTTAELMVDRWTRTNAKMDFKAIKEDMLTTHSRENSVGKKDTFLNEENLIKFVVDMCEFWALIQPLMTFVTFLCDEARDPVLVESIKKTKMTNLLTKLLRDLWLSDINPGVGRKELTRSIRNLPKAEFIRNAIAGLLMARVYWKQWEREGRLIRLVSQLRA
jgi:hypothetical protein